MKNLVIQPTETTPYVNFDVQNRLFEISGRSIPANAEELFFEIRQWLVDFLNESGSDIIELNMNLEYFNTASHKYIAELFKIIFEKTPNSIINWYYHIDDDEMKQVGEIFDRIFSLKFNLISFQDED